MFMKEINTINLLITLNQEAKLLRSNQYLEYIFMFTYMINKEFETNILSKCTINAIIMKKIVLNHINLKRIK